MNATFDTETEVVPEYLAGEYLAGDILIAEIEIPACWADLMDISAMSEDVKHAKHRIDPDNPEAFKDDLRQATCVFEDQSIGVIELSSNDLNYFITVSVERPDGASLSNDSVYYNLRRLAGHVDGAIRPIVVSDPDSRENKSYAFEVVLVEDATFVGMSIYVDWSPTFHGYVMDDDYVLVNDRHRYGGFEPGKIRAASAYTAGDPCQVESSDVLSSFVRNLERINKSEVPPIWLAAFRRVVMTGGLKGRKPKRQ